MKRRFSIIVTTLVLLLVCALVLPNSVHATEVASGTCGTNVTWTLDDEGTLTIYGRGTMKSSPWNLEYDYCEDITSVVIQNGVTSICEYAFCACTNLVSVEIPSSVKSIGDYAFEQCELLSSISIPGSVKSIGRSAFYNCTSLENIELSEGVTSIGSFAFGFCEDLRSITIPRSITAIAVDAFYGCASLSEICVDEENTSYSTDACGALLNEGNTALIWVPVALTEYNIPAGVTNIGIAFSDCSNLERINIPAGVTSLDDFAFSDCSSLVSIEIPESVTSIGSDAFFMCSSLPSITIPDGVAIIDEWTFLGCNSLTSIEIPASVTTIGWLAFGGCNSLADVYYGGSSEEWEMVVIEDGNGALLNANIHFNASGATTVVQVNGVSVTENADGSYTATANVTGGSGFYAYNYWLYDSTGTIVDRHENTFDTTWTFEKPADGIYLMRIYATDFTTESYNDSSWFAVTSPYENVAVSNVTVTENEDGTYTATADVTGGSGFYAYNYWLFDSTGTIVGRHENTFDTSWTFEKPENGIYLMRIYATDFTTDSHGDSAWFAVTSPAEGVTVTNVTVTENEDGTYTATANVTGGSGFYAYNYWLFDATGTIVDRHENTFDTSWTFEKPENGIYLMRIYATDFTTDSHGDGPWFAVTD